MPVPYTFGTATAAIPLSQLDSNFATAITLGNTAVYLGNTTTSLGNVTLTNVTISSGTSNIAANVSTAVGLLPEAQGGTGTTTGYYGFKNRIINGAMVINQRATAVTSSAYTVDRFEYAASVASKATVSQDTSVYPTGFNASLKVLSSSAYAVGASELFVIRQCIEGFNIADLGWGTASAKTVTMSFWVYSSLTGTFGGALENASVNRCYVFSYSIPVANTWTQITVTIAGDTTGTWNTTNDVGVRIAFGLGVGSSVSGTAGSWGSTRYFSATGATSVVGTNGATFYITGVQLEKGSTATSFDYRPYGTELALCQRYCYVYRILSGTFNAFGIGGFFETTTATVLPTRHPVEMRAAPTFSFTAANTFYCQTTSNVTPSAISLSNASTLGGVISATVSGVTAGTGCHLIRNNNNGSETTITASAEL